MAEKTFIVSHGRAEEPLTVTGKNLKDALEKEGLDPDLWQLEGKPKPEENPSEFVPDAGSRHE